MNQEGLEELKGLLDKEINITRKLLCNFIGEEAYDEFHRLMDKRLENHSVNFENFAEVKGDK